MKALRGAHLALVARAAVLESRAQRADDEADRLRALELAVAGLRARISLVGAALVIVIPIAVRLLG